MTVLIASLVLLAPQSASPSALISKALARYAGAKTLVGRVVWTQAALSARVVTTTDLQLERPDKLYLRQTREGKNPQTWLVTSDGVTFSYDKPDYISLGPPRLEEKVQKRDMRLTLADIYNAAAASLGDRSPVVDIAVSHPGYLKEFVKRLATVAFGPPEKLKGRDVKTIHGDLRDRPDGSVVGTYQLHLTDEGDILRYAERTVFADRAIKEKVEITSVWDVDLKVDAAPNVDLFHSGR